MNEAIKIGEFAKIAGVTTRTIRYYEELGLLNPSSYSEGGLRLYSDLDLLRLKLINNLKELNFSLERIKLILYANSDPENIRTKKGNIPRGLEEQFYEAGNKMNRYLNIEEDIRSGINLLKSCLDCDKKPCFITCSECRELPRNGLPLSLKAVF